MTANAISNDVEEPQSGSLRHVQVRPKILYFGTPVVLVTTLNPDGGANIGPMSSAWALGNTLVLGWATQSQTILNLERCGECVVNVPDASLHEKVEALAHLTGRNPPAAHKAGTFRYEPDKFGAAGWTAQPSELVAAPRIAECSLQLECTVTAIQDPVGPDRDGFRIVELNVERVYAARDVVIEGTDHIDPRRWVPLLYVFRHYFGTGPELGRTFRAET